MDIVADVITKVVAEAVSTSFEHGAERPSKDATEESNPRKPLRVQDANKNDVVVRTPPPKQNWDDSVNVEAGIVVDTL